MARVEQLEEVQSEVGNTSSEITPGEDLVGRRFNISESYVVLGISKTQFFRLRNELELNEGQSEGTAIYFTGEQIENAKVKLAERQVRIPKPGVKQPTIPDGHLTAEESAGVLGISAKAFRKRKFPFTRLYGYGQYKFYPVESILAEQDILVYERALKAQEQAEKEKGKKSSNISTAKIKSESSRPGHELGVRVTKPRAARRESEQGIMAEKKPAALRNGARDLDNRSMGNFEEEMPSIFRDSNEARETLLNLVAENLSMLSSDQLAVIDCLYGYSGDKMTLEETCEFLGMDSQMIRRLEREASGRLRIARRREQLKIKLDSTESEIQGNKSA